jgi:hypothetical protein
MNKIDNFKEFVKNNNYLVSYVRDRKKTWQELYEIYDMYGENKNIWDEYLKESKEENKKNNNTFNELLDMAKNMDVEKVQSGITSLQKAIGLFGDLFIGSKTANGNGNTSNYEPRPIYKRFDD